MTTKRPHKITLAELALALGEKREDVERSLAKLVKLGLLDAATGGPTERGLAYARELAKRDPKLHDDVRAVAAGWRAMVDDA